MAHIRKLKSGRFQAQIRQSGLKTISRTFDLRKDAKKWATSIEANQEKVERLGSRNNQTLADLIDKYLDYYDQEYDAGRVKDDHAKTRLAFWKDRIGGVRLLDLNSDHVRSGIRFLIRKRGLKPQTTNRFKSALSKAISWAIEETEELDNNTERKIFVIKTNPCRGVPSKSEGKGRKRVFSEDEINRFLKAAKKSSWDQFYMLVLMGTVTGARRGEILKLTWKDINFSEKKAFLANTKNGSNRAVTLDNTALIQELMKFRGHPDSKVFQQPGRRVVDYRNEWSEALKLAEIPKTDAYGERLVFHSLRHSFCTRLINNNVNPAVVQKLAGHASYTTTQRYVHPDEEKALEVASENFKDVG